MQKDGFRLATKWERLAIPNFGKTDALRYADMLSDQTVLIIGPEAATNEPVDELEMHTVSISIKNLQKFLATNLANTTTIACEPLSGVSSAEPF